MAARDRFLAALRAVAGSLAELPPRSGAVIGGVAANARGVERFTADIDALVRGDTLSVDAALPLFAGHGLVPRSAAAIDLARRRHVLLLVHEPSGVQVDVSFGFLPFEHEALDAATAVSFDTIKVAVVRAEDLVIQKAVAWRPIDRQDIERLLVLWGREMDLERVRSWVAQFAELLDDTDRLGELDRLISRSIDH